MTFIILRRLRPNLRHTAWQSMTWQSSRTSSRLLRMEEHHSTQTVLICLWDIRTMFSMRWIFRMNYRHYIHQGPFFHTFLGEKLPDWKAAAALVKKIAENYRLPYYTISPTYSVCSNHGYINGEVYECPDCGEKTEVYSRITGYYRPVQNWNDGKQQEYKERKLYDPKNSVLKASKTPKKDISFASEAKRRWKKPRKCFCLQPKLVRTVRWPERSLKVPGFHLKSWMPRNIRNWCRNTVLCRLRLWSYCVGTNSRRTVMFPILRSMQNKIIAADHRVCPILFHNFWRKFIDTPRSVLYNMKM